MRIRAHNLLCIQGFVGKGYSPEFVANMAEVIAGLRNRSEVTVLAEPDAICDACPNLSSSGCALHGEGSERGIVRQDRDVMARLGIEEGAVLDWGEIVERIAERIRPHQLDDICGECPWLPLGVCKDGLRALRS
ncbi:MAG: DUF1284 domain-containing protein [Planctomycetota bacterium]|jgi:hypothetical protein